jgi:hypothetical protein
MKKTEMPDHAIAHSLHQGLLEKVQIQSIADVQEFFENEELEVEGL